MTGMPDCIVCGNNLHRNWLWTDANGVGFCATCGMTYVIAGCRNFTETKPSIREDEIPIFKEYWNETHQAVSLGFFMGQSPIQRERILAFNAWIEEKHPELIKTKEGAVEQDA